MSERLPTGPKRARVALAMRRRSSSPPPPAAIPVVQAAGGVVAPEELHRWRVAWGHYWGNRVRELTNEWKKELR